MSNWKMLIAKEIVKRIRTYAHFVAIEDIKNIEHPAAEKEDLYEIIDIVLTNYPEIDAFFLGNDLFFGERSEVEDFRLDYQGY